MDETIQINAEERATLEDQYGIDEDIIEYVTDNDESTNYVMISMRTTNYSSFWRRMPSTKMR